MPEPARADLAAHPIAPAPVAAASREPLAAALTSAGTPIEESMRQEIVQALFRNRPHALVVGALFTVIYVWMFIGRVAEGTLWAWVGAMALASAHGLHGWLAFRRAQQQPNWDSRHFLHVYSRQTWLIGFLLGLTGWLFYAPEFGDARWVAVFMIQSFVFGLVGLLALHLPLYYAWLGLLTVPLAARFAVSGAPGGWVGWVLFVFCIVTIIPFARRQARIVQETTRIRHEKAALVTQLEAATQELAAANDAKSRFFAAASHDLRQPVQAIGYYTELLQPQGGDVQTVDRIRQCVASLDGLLEGVLTLARLDAGKVHKHVFAVDLGAMAGRLHHLYEGVAAARGLQLRVRAPKQAWAMTDAVHLERVMGNLLANALRYTPAGGVLLALRRRRQAWRVQVIDTGIGIAPDAQATVFDEFVQLNNPQRDVNQGVGLGLATVRRLCALLEHPLSLRSRPGRGSVFSIDVPACAPPLSSGDDPSQAHPAALSSEPLQGRVLIVEDNADVRESLAHMLQQWGLDGVACANGAEALALWQDGRFDVVLSDWRLPGELHGGQVIDALRRLPGGDRCRYALITGETDESILGTVPTGVEVLRKPLRPIRLRAWLSAQQRGSPPGFRTS